MKIILTMNIILIIISLLSFAVGVLAYTVARDVGNATYFIALACFMLLSRSKN